MLTDYFVSLFFGRINHHRTQAKEISWFHAVIWPALLMALDLPLPKKARVGKLPRSPSFPLCASHHPHAQHNNAAD